MIQQKLINRTQNFTPQTMQMQCRVINNRASIQNRIARVKIASSQSRRSPLATTRAAAKDSSSVQSEIDEVPAPGCFRYSVSLSKPLGLVLEENKTTGTITVAEIVPGGNADNNGLISVGDLLIATSGFTRTTEQMYGEISVKGGEQMVRIVCRGESFDTVLAAISSIPGNFQVKLEFQQC